MLVDRPSARSRIHPVRRHRRHAPGPLSTARSPGPCPGPAALGHPATHGLPVTDRRGPPGPRAADGPGWPSRPARAAPSPPGRPARGPSARRHPRSWPAFDPPAEPWAAGHRGVDLLGSPGQAGADGTPRAGHLSPAPIAGRGVVVVAHGATRTTYEPVLGGGPPSGDAVPSGDRIGHLELAGSHCFPRRVPALGLAARPDLPRPSRPGRRGPRAAAPPRRGPPPDAGPQPARGPAGDRWLRPWGAPAGRPAAAGRW